MDITRTFFRLSFAWILHGLICKVIYPDIDISENIRQALLTFIFGMGTWISNINLERMIYETS